MVTTGERVRIAIGAILWFLVTVFFLLALPVVLAASGWIVVGAVLLALLLAIPVFFLLRSHRRKTRRTTGITTYLAATAAIAMALVAAIGFPVYYMAYTAESDPLLMPQATLTDGTKTVVFQGMVHIGSDTFYRSVIFDLEKALADGYVLFYEGVQPGDAESDAWFSRMLAGGGDLSANYKLLADVCGVRFQLDYFDLLGKDMAEHPEQHVTADVTNRQMMDEWQRLTAADPSLEARAEAEAGSGGADAGIFGWLAEQDEGRKKIGGILCQAMMGKALGADQADKPMKPVILDFRNKELARRIEEFPGDRIYITYGAAHLPGVIADLKAIDPAWHVENIRWVRAIAPEREYEGDDSALMP